MIKSCPLRSAGYCAPGSGGIVAAAGECARGLHICLGVIWIERAARTARSAPRASKPHRARHRRLGAAHCFCYSTPLRLPKTVLTVMDKLQRDCASILVPASSAARTASWRE
ncbi:hypothetical protein BDZ97DRAFT_1192084 [Flammula alnicola]|nr:hypothetical protein BDZ97DRAFT_1192084 [Flammula alnicola]